MNTITLTGIAILLIFLLALTALIKASPGDMRFRGKVKAGEAIQGEIDIKKAGGHEVKKDTRYPHTKD